MCLRVGATKSLQVNKQITIHKNKMKKEKKKMDKNLQHKSKMQQEGEKIICKLTCFESRNKL